MLGNLRDRPMEELVDEVQGLAAVGSQAQVQSIAALAARCTIDVSGVGFGVQRGSSARIRDSEIAGASGGVEVGDSSGMRTDGTVTMTSQFGPALSVFRSASADLRGTVNATSTGGGTALEVFGTSTVRNRNGLTTLEGDVFVSGQSLGDLRDVAVVGDVFIIGNSTLLIGEGTVDGDMHIFSQALLLEPGGSLNVTGTIECAPFLGGYVADFGSLTAGSIVGCPVQCSVDADCSSVDPGSTCLWGRCTF